MKILHERYVHHTAIKIDPAGTTWAVHQDSARHGSHVWAHVAIALSHPDRTLDLFAIELVGLPHTGHRAVLRLNRFPGGHSASQNSPLLNRCNLLLQASHDAARTKFHHVDGSDRFQMRTHLNDLSRISYAHQQCLRRTFRKRAVVVQVKERLHTLAPLIFWFDGVYHA